MILMLFGGDCTHFTHAISLPIHMYIALAIMPKLHSRPCDYLYVYHQALCLRGESRGARLGMRLSVLEGRAGERG